jgi:hypothetical protein
MLGTVYLLYRAASELLDRDLAMVTVILFSLPAGGWSSRPSTRVHTHFAALAINACIYLLSAYGKRLPSWPARDRTDVGVDPKRRQISALQSMFCIAIVALTTGFAVSLFLRNQQTPSPYP